MNRDKYIEEINSITAGEEFKARTKQMLLQEIKTQKYLKKKRKGTRKIFWTAAASIFILIGSIALMSSLFYGDEQRVEQDSLPLLTVPEEQHKVGAHGGAEILMLQDIEELTRGNPWDKEANLETLPVFQNKAPRDGAGIPQDGLSQEEMHAKAEEIAGYLDETINRKEEQDFGLIAELGKYQLTIEKTGAVEVTFAEPMTIPELDDLQQEAERTDYGKVLNGLLEEYEELAGMKEPGHDIWYTYNLEGEKNWRVSAYESSGDLEERTIGYNFNTLDFVFNHNNQLYIIRKFTPEVGEKLGDYPIITPEEAEQMLLKGDYYTTVNETTPEEGKVKKVELVYDTSGFEEYFMPYYKFYVTVPTEKRYDQAEIEEKLNGFGVYYVSAVERDFLETNNEKPLFTKPRKAAFH